MTFCNSFALWYFVSTLSAKGLTPITKIFVLLDFKCICYIHHTYTSTVYYSYKCFSKLIFWFCFSPYSGESVLVNLFSFFRELFLISKLCTNICLPLVQQHRGLAGFAAVEETSFFVKWAVSVSCCNVSFVLDIYTSTLFTCRYRSTKTTLVTILTLPVWAILFQSSVKHLIRSLISNRVSSVLFLLAQPFLLMLYQLDCACAERSNFYWVFPVLPTTVLLCFVHDAVDSGRA